MTAQKRAIKIALASRDKSQRWLADKLGMSPQNLNSRLRRGTLKDEDMTRIADILNMQWTAEFTEKE